MIGRGPDHDSVVREIFPAGTGSCLALHDGRYKSWRAGVGTAGSFAQAAVSSLPIVGVFVGLPRRTYDTSIGARPSHNVVLFPSSHLLSRPLPIPVLPLL